MAVKNSEIEKFQFLEDLFDFDAAHSTFRLLSLLVSIDVNLAQYEHTLFH